MNAKFIIIFKEIKLKIGQYSSSALSSCIFNPNEEMKNSYFLKKNLILQGVTINIRISA